MPLSEKLDKGFESLVDTLFGSGQQEYYKGGLMRSRIGANDALTQYRGSQTRGMDFDLEQKQKLIEALTGEGESSKRMLRGVQFDDPSNYIAAAIPSERENTRNKTLIEMLGSEDPLSQTLARDLQLGMTGPQSASRRRTDLIAPEEVNLLKAQTGDIGAARTQAGNLNVANIAKIKQQEKTGAALAGKYGQETRNLIEQGLIERDTGILNLQRIEAVMGQEAAESAAKINASKSKKAENDKNFSLANEKLIQLQREGQDKKTAMDNLRKIKVKDDLTLADFAAVGGLSNVFDQGMLGGLNRKRGLSAITNAISKMRQDFFDVTNMSTWEVTQEDGSMKAMRPMEMSEKQRNEVLDRETVKLKQQLLTMGYDMSMIEDAEKSIKDGGGLAGALQGTSQGGGGSKPLNSDSASAIANKFRNSRPKPTN